MDNRAYTGEKGQANGSGQHAHYGQHGPNGHNHNGVAPLKYHDGMFKIARPTVYPHLQTPKGQPDSQGVDPENVAVGIEDEEFDDTPTDFNHNCCTRAVESIDNAYVAFRDKYRKQIIFGIKAILLLAYFAYFIYCMQHEFGDEGSVMLLVITCWIVFIIICRGIEFFNIGSDTWDKIQEWWQRPGTLKARHITRYILYVVVTIGGFIFLVFDTLEDHSENWIPFAGVFVFYGLGYIMSQRPSRVNWHTVYWGLILQFALAYFILRTDPGYEAFKWIGEAVEQFFEWSDSGGEFVFGGKTYYTLGLAFTGGVMLIFFNACLYLLTVWGVVDYVITRGGYFLSWCLDTGPVESIIAASGVFIGPAEVTLVVRQYIDILTTSEIFTIMTSSFASISGMFLAIYLMFGTPAHHLLTAAVISAPAALAVAKLMYPETQRVNMRRQTQVATPKSERKKGWIAAISEGAVLSVPIIGAVTASIIAFYSILHMVDEILHWAGERAGSDRISFEYICSYVLYPVSFFMGVDKDDRRTVGALIGKKLVTTSVLSYRDLGIIRVNQVKLDMYEATTNGTWHWSKDNIILDLTGEVLKYGVMSERSMTIATYALCGFSTFPSIAFSVGVLINLAPKRKAEFMKIVFKAFIAGNLASFLTGAVAGVMYTSKND